MVKMLSQHRPRRRKIPSVFVFLLVAVSVLGLFLKILQDGPSLDLSVFQLSSSYTYSDANMTLITQANLRAVEHIKSNAINNKLFTLGAAQLFDGTKLKKVHINRQLDIILPVSGESTDAKIRIFCEYLGKAVKRFSDLQSHKPTGERLHRLRLLLTRFPQDVQTTKEEQMAFQQELLQLVQNQDSQQEHIIVEVQLVVVQGEGVKFQRARARNVLQQAACHELFCLVAGIDVDMQILPDFFVHALEHVVPMEKVYFPIVWSAYNPKSIELVTQHMAKQKNDPKFVPYLEPYSEHRGHWRDYGYGMYVLGGPDAQRFQWDESYKGWGGEDGDFYRRIEATQGITVVRQNEAGLVHQWHPKNCRQGIDVHTPAQMTDCLGSRLGEEGSELGKQLIKQWQQEQRMRQRQKTQQPKEQGLQDQLRQRLAQPRAQQSNGQPQQGLAQQQGQQQEQLEPVIPAQNAVQSIAVQGQQQQQAQSVIPQQTALQSMAAQGQQQQKSQPVVPQQTALQSMVAQGQRQKQAQLVVPQQSALQAMAAPQVAQQQNPAEHLGTSEKVQELAQKNLQVQLQQALS